MDRRKFVKNVLIATAAVTVAPGIVHSCSAEETDNELDGMAEYIWELFSAMYSSTIVDEQKLVSDKAALLSKTRCEYARILKETGGVDEGSGLGFVYRWGAMSCAFYLACGGAMKREHFAHIIDKILADEEIMGVISSGSDIFSAASVQSRKEAALRSQKKEYPYDWVFYVDDQTSADELSFKYTECCLCKIAAAQGCKEILPEMCALDGSIYKRRGANLTRTMTLAAGDSCCDFFLKKI